MTKSYNTLKHIKSTLPISSPGWFYPSILGWPGTSSLPCWLGVPLQPRQQGLFLCWLLLQGMPGTCVQWQHTCPKLGGVHLPMWRKCTFSLKSFPKKKIRQENTFSIRKWPISIVLRTCNCNNDHKYHLWNTLIHYHFQLFHSFGACDWFRFDQTGGENNWSLFHFFFFKERVLFNYLKLIFGQVRMKTAICMDLETSPCLITCPAVISKCFLLVKYHCSSQTWRKT